MPRGKKGPSPEPPEPFRARLRCLGCQRIYHTSDGLYCPHCGAPGGVMHDSEQPEAASSSGRTSALHAGDAGSIPAAATILASGFGASPEEPKQEVNGAEAPPVTSAPLFDTLAFDADAAFTEVARLNELVRAAQIRYNLAKESARDAKKCLESVSQELSDLIAERAYKQRQTDRMATQPVLQDMTDSAAC